MKLPVVIDPQAQKEWDEAVGWYEQCEEGLGLRFNAIVRQYIDTISSEYERFRFFTRLTQKAKIVGWPYSIFFVVNHNFGHIKVVAVWEGHQKPSKLLRRMK